MNATTAVVIDRTGLDELIRVLMADGYRVVGPTVRDSAIVLAELDSPDQLPAGWRVDAAPGHYRLRPRDDAAVFAHSAGPQSWKQFLHPARQRLWSSQRDGAYSAESTDVPRYAFIGVRGCDLAAIGILDTVLARGATRIVVLAPPPWDIRAGGQLHRTGWGVLLRLHEHRTRRHRRL